MFIPTDCATALSLDSTSMQKVYAIDAGMAYTTARANQQDISNRFETAIYIDLLRRASDTRAETITSYTAPTSKREKVDFLVGDALGLDPYKLIQVYVDMEASKTRARELDSLTVAMSKTGIKEGTIITLREEAIEHFEDGSVAHIVPAWKWSLLN